MSNFCIFDYQKNAQAVQLTVDIDGKLQRFNQIGESERERQRRRDRMREE